MSTKTTCNNINQKLIEELKVGTLNCRGIRSQFEKTALADDLVKYGLDIVAIQESHIRETGLEIITTTDGKTKFDLYLTGDGNHSYHGVGIAVRTNCMQGSFSKISNRICTFKTKLNNHQLNFICAYAPTLAITKKDPQQTEDFYNQVESAINHKNNRSSHLTIIAGDLNAQTGSACYNNEYLNHIGKYGKGKLNLNGEHLLELCTRNDLVLTNTLFCHKLCHRTTWTCPERKNSARKNPYRNQIDYIIVNNKFKSLLIDSRSFGGIETQTDHKLVKAKLKLNWYKAYQKENSNANRTKLDIGKLKNEETKTAYQKQIEEIIQNEYNSDTDPQNIWNSITNSCKESAKKNNRM